MGNRQPANVVQRRFIIVGAIFTLLGCLLGTLAGTYYAWQIEPAVYSGGALANELAPGYRGEYLKMVTDSYTVNRNAELAALRLDAFSNEEKIRALGERYADYVANGQAAEAQATSELALALRNQQGWEADLVSNQLSALASQYQSENDAARQQAISAFGSSLGFGEAPAPDADQQPAAEGEQAPAEEQAPAAEGEQAPAEQAPPPAEEGGISWLLWIVVCLGLLVVVAIALLLYSRLSGGQKPPEKPKVEWEGEGPAPIKQWSSTYTLGQDGYDEFFTIETNDGDFLGEAGMGIYKAHPGTSPKQVYSFDVGLFDKTDITTLSRAVMAPAAYNDPSMRQEIDANPQAEAVLAEPGQTFEMETTALRIVAKIEEVDLSADDNYFNKLKVALDVFIKEDADLRIGEMDVPEEYQS